MTHVSYGTATAFLSALRLPLTRSPLIARQSRTCATLRPNTQSPPPRNTENDARSHRRRGNGGAGHGEGRRGRGGYASGTPRPATYSRNKFLDMQHRPTPSSPTASTADLMRNTQRTTSTTLSEMTIVRFSDLPLAASLLKAISEELKYETMTMVQSKSIPVALTGRDVLVKARTGTGKTLAFLTAAFNRSLQGTVSRSQTAVLVISPTRELAQQIADEASVLLSHTPGSRAQVVFGGTNVKRDYNNLRANGAPFLLVATPGRLLDHLTTPGTGFKEALSGLSALILDEADQLLDMGFRKEIEKIMAELPNKVPRQTLLFSATMPEDVRYIAKLVLRKEYDVIDCVGEAKSTHEHVSQSVCITPVEDQVAALNSVLQHCMKVPSFKVIVFFTTARLTQYFAELFELMGQPVLEIHSRKSQGHRTRMSNRFRAESNIIMFTSNVMARGLDFPDVTCVLQVGLPSDKAQYVHRIGRTARAGKVGNGILLLADYEVNFLNTIKEIPLQKIGPPTTDSIFNVNAEAAAASAKLPSLTKSAAYQSWIGYYNSNLKILGWTKGELVQRANHWVTTVVGEREPPMLLARTVGKMGLKGTPGLRVQRGSDASSGRGRRDGGMARGAARDRGANRARAGRG